MSGRKPWFKARIGWVGDYDDHLHVTKSHEFEDEYRVRLVDARELTAEQAVELVLNQLHGVAGWADTHIKVLAGKVNMTATVKNGKVRVRRVKR